jgi:hypothetical protein
MKNNVSKGIFDSLNPDADIFKEIIKQRPNWWKLFCENNDLYINIRKDNYINVYYYGGALAKITYTNDFYATIHEKYLGKDGEKYVKLDLNSLTADKIKKIKANIQKVYLDKGDSEKPVEKKIQGEMVLKNSNYIDSEFQYNQDKDLRIDLIELYDGKLSFVELKGITDNRLRNDEKRNPKNPEIIEQMKKYEDFISKYKDEIVEYYKKLIQLKNDLGLSEQNTDFTLNKTPKLIIVNTYPKMTKGREERIQAIKNLMEEHKIDYKIIPYFLHQTC